MWCVCASESVYQAVLNAKTIAVTQNTKITTHEVFILETENKQTIKHIKELAL